MLTPQVLLDDYNEYRNYTNNVFKLRQEGRYVSSLKLTKERKMSLLKMTEFCWSRNMDPRLWLYSLFQKRRWMFSPQFDQLITAKHIAHYEGMQGSPKFEEKLRDEAFGHQLAEGRDYDPNRDISATTEALKRKYLAAQETDRCMDETQTQTMGFHPKSLVCSRCPVAKMCEATLSASMPFDVIALRRGDITAEQCRNAALRSRHGRA